MGKKRESAEKVYACPRCKRCLAKCVIVGARRDAIRLALKMCEDAIQKRQQAAKIWAGTRVLHESQLMVVDVLAGLRKEIVEAAKQAGIEGIEEKG